ncbi:MAG: GGDEF domain-containing protein [Methylovulum sp.]|nr:GGDEF domain-containing protein [Methylovulum sp.]
MKTLDIRTMMVMISVLTLLFSGLLALAGLHAGNIRGMRQWALASLCISLSLGLGLIYTQQTPDVGWAIACGATLMATGMSLQLSGIKAFKEEPFNWRIWCLLIVLVSTQNVWFAVIHPDVSARVIANSLVFAMMNAACVRELLVRIESPLRTAYWFTGTAFAVQTAVFLIRAVMVLSAPKGTYGLYAPLPINPVMFFIASITLLCLTFGFVLLLNYRLAADLQELASRDMLTGALNRRSLELEAACLQARFTRTGDTLTVMMLDVDHFKLINDSYGHPVGDAVLQRLAAVIQGSIRTCDYFARYGGEEFCLLLPSTTEEGAFVTAERLRATYAAMAMDIGGKSLHSTISIGIADSKQVGLTFQALVFAADQAMYRAKRDGRNRVVRYSGLTG